MGYESYGMTLIIESPLGMTQSFIPYQSELECER